jgi:hypothetical protein
MIDVIKCSKCMKHFTNEDYVANYIPFPTLGVKVSSLHVPSKALCINCHNKRIKNEKNDTK